jgi:hypothetical protein
LGARRENSFEGLGGASNAQRRRKPNSTAKKALKRRRAWSAVDELPHEKTVHSELLSELVDRRKLPGRTPDEARRTI